MKSVKTVRPRSLSSKTLQLRCITLLMIVWTAPVNAKQIGGQVSHQSRPAAKAEVTIECSGVSESTKTDSYGRFGVTLDKDPPCSLTVKFRDVESEKLSFPVQGSSTHLNVNLRRWKDKWLLDTH